MRVIALSQNCWNLLITCDQHGVIFSFFAGTALYFHYSVLRLRERPFEGPVHAHPCRAGKRRRYCKHTRKTYTGVLWPNHSTPRGWDCRSAKGLVECLLPILANRRSASIENWCCFDGMAAQKDALTIAAPFFVRRVLSTPLFAPRFLSVLRFRYFFHPCLLLHMMRSFALK